MVNLPVVIAADSSIRAVGKMVATLVAVLALPLTANVIPGYCDVIRRRYADFTGNPTYAP